MKISSVSNSQNYNNQQNFGMQIPLKVIKGIKRDIRENGLSLNVDNFFDTIKGSASDAVKLRFMTINRFHPTGPRDFLDAHWRKYSYRLGDKKYKYSQRGDFFSFFDEDKDSNIRCIIIEDFSSMLKKIIIKLAYKGKLKQNIEQLKKDFPHNHEDITRLSKSMQAMDARNAKFSAEHPILGRILLGK